MKKQKMEWNGMEDGGKIISKVRAERSEERIKDVTVQCSRHNTIQYNTIQYNTIQYNTIQYNTIQ